MLLNDPLGVFRRDVPIPRAFRVHDGDRTGRTDPEALASRAIDGTVRSGDIQLLQAILDVLPRLFAFVGLDAVGTAAHEQMPDDLADAEGGGGRFGSRALFGHSRQNTLPCPGTS